MSSHEFLQRSLNQIFQQGLQQLRSQQSGNYMAVGPILSVALKVRNNLFCRKHGTQRKTWSL